MNERKYALAAFFHDIGIWTDQTIDYLGPSITQATLYLGATNEELGNEISAMIYWHHKLSRYQGTFSETVEIFRKADWCDVSLGICRFGLGKKELASYRQQYPNLGFHWFLMRKIVRNFFRHPLNPLPMFTR